MNEKIRNLIGEIKFHPRLRRVFYPKYRYQFYPAQLCFLCRALDETKHVAGSILEVGCDRGETTVFLKKHMEFTGMEKPYIAIDTFSGFIDEDVKYEQEQRGKSFTYKHFKHNKKKWFDGTMRQNGFDDVISIKADINQYDLTRHAPVSFALLDVDLYRPMKKGLSDLYKALSPGGILIVDDCNEIDTRWDGSDQAYKEFVEEIGQPVDIVLNKIGIVRKPKD